MKIYETKVIKTKTNSYIPKTKLRPVKRVTVNNIEVGFASELDLDDELIMVFVDALYPGDLLQIEFGENIERDNQRIKKLFTKSRYGKGAIYKLYTDVPKLKFNSKYTFHLETDKCNEIEFKSKYDPFYSSISAIRKDTGTLLEKVSDEIIASVIFDNSLLVLEKLTEEDDGFIVENMQETLDEIFEDGVPLHAKNYVRYKTDIDICYSIYLSRTGKLGSFKKKLGDLDVSSEVKVSDLNDMISRFKELLKPNEELLDGSSNDFTMGFVKAGSTAYTVANRGVF